MIKKVKNTVPWIYVKVRLNLKVELKLSNYAKEADLKNARTVDTSDFPGKTDLAHLKSDVDN